MILPTPVARPWVTGVAFVRGYGLARLQESGGPARAGFEAWLKHVTDTDLSGRPCTRDFRLCCRGSPNRRVDNAFGVETAWPCSRAVQISPSLDGRGVSTHRRVDHPRSVESDSALQ